MAGESFDGQLLTSLLSGYFICSISSDGRLERLNPTWTSELGWTEDELLARPLWDFIHPSDLEPFHLTLSNAGAKPSRFVSRIQKRAGAWRWLDWSVIAGQGHELYAFARDVSDQKAAVEAAQEAGCRIRQIIETARDAFVAIDEEARIGEWNPQAEATFGWSRAEALGRDIIETIIPEHSRLGLKAALTQFAEFGEEGVNLPEPLAVVSRNFDISEPFETTALHRDGHEFPIEFTVSPVRTSGAFCLNVFLRDISGRKEGEQVVERQRQQLLEAQSAGGFGSWEWYAGSDKIEISDELRRIMGIEGHPMTFSDLLTRVHPHDRQLGEHVIRVAQANGAPYSLEFRVVRPDGTVRSVLSRGRTIPASDGMPSRMLGMVQDITDRKRAEETIAASEARVRRIIETAHDAFIEVNAKGGIVDWSPRAEAILGWSAEEAIGRSLIDAIVPERNREATSATLRQFATQGASQVIARVVEQTVVHRDGHEFPAELSVSSLGSGEDTCFSVFLRDVTERNRTLEITRQSERLAAVGQLAAGLAHDFNNIVSVISACAELLTSQPLDGAGVAHLAAIRQQADGARGLVWQILDFARHGSVKPSAVDLTEFLSGFLPVMQRIFSDDVTIDVRTDQGPHLVQVDPLRLQQILMNLVVNSRDAMEGPGAFEINLSRVDWVDTETAMPENSREGPWVRIDVVDAGTGIPDEVLGRVLEPFFTTKPVGQGSGLGLAQVYGLVAQQEGHLALRSSDDGTTVSIWLPAVDRAASDATSQRPGQRSSRAAGRPQMVSGVGSGSYLGSRKSWRDPYGQRTARFLKRQDRSGSSGRIPK